MGAYAALVAAMAVAVEHSFQELQGSVRKTLVLVCAALVTLLTGARSEALVARRLARGFYPVLIEQTKIGSAEALTAAVPGAGNSTRP